MSTKQSTKPPSGTRDFLPDEVRRRTKAIDVIRRVYERYGYEPLETPAFENIETLLGKYGEEGNKLIYKILRRGEHEQTGQADLALRYDLTVPLARVVAEHQAKLPKFFKRYQIQPVWRADRPAKGRFREFYQCDVDAIGSRSPLVEVELIAAVSEVLSELQFEDFVIKINHREVLRSLLTNAGIPPEQHSDALVAVDKLDKIRADGVRKELVERGVSDQGANALLNWVGAAYRTDWLPWLQQQFAAISPEGEEGFANLNEILELAKNTPAADKLRFEPALARGLSYYTGAIMEITAPGGIGSLGGGGRYDGLIGMFSKQPIPACGFSLGLERILALMAERESNHAAESRGSVDVLITVWDKDSIADSLALAGRLRERGLKVSVYPEPGKIGGQLSYASEIGAHFAIIVGSEEKTQGHVTVKDLYTRQETKVPRVIVAEHVLAIRDGTEALNPLDGRTRH